MNNGSHRKNRLWSKQSCLPVANFTPRRHYQHTKLLWSDEQSGFQNLEVEVDTLWGCWSWQLQSWKLLVHVFPVWSEAQLLQRDKPENITNCHSPRNTAPSTKARKSSLQHPLFTCDFLNCLAALLTKNTWEETNCSTAISWRPTCVLCALPTKGVQLNKSVRLY